VNRGIPGLILPGLVVWDPETDLTHLYILEVPQMRVKLLALAIAALVSLTAAGSAHANGKAVVTIDNPTPNVVKYQFKWGDNAEWQTYELQPGQARTHWHTLSELDLAPRPFVRFDSILNDDDVTFKTYHLDFFDSYGTGYNDGKIYKFITNGRVLDLLQK
jgi:hypothetical protein